MEPTQIEKIVFDAIEQLDEHIASAVTRDTTLFGAEGILDSISLVTLIVLVEQEVSGQLGVNISLTDDRAMSQIRSPFSTVGMFIEYIESCLKEK